MTYRSPLLSIASVAMGILLPPLAPLVAQVTCPLAKQGRVLQPVIVSESASPSVREAAAQLASLLQKITTAGFEVQTGDGTRGIAVGTAADFPAWQLVSRFAPQQRLRREEYLLRSYSAGVLVIGATDEAVQHAVWDLLYRLGYRQYFPGAVWEVIPSIPAPEVSVDTWQRPDYHARKIWYGYGTWDDNEQPYQDWCRKNRAVSGYRLNTGHAWDRVVQQARSRFETQPNYWPLLNGSRQPVKNPKPCLSQPEVRQIFVDYALRQLRQNPDQDSVSVDPSDGGGWCECPACADLGSVSDQVILLANQVATEVQQEFPGRRVGLYAYNYHSSPPTIPVHKNVVISVATSFIKGGQSLSEILQGWSAQGATLGIREYYSVHPWDRDLPAASRASRPDYLCRTIPDFHRQGARFMSAESGDNWGPSGFGYFLAARLLWDVQEADQAEALFQEFLDLAFEDARKPMAEFYAQLNGDQDHLVTDDQLGRMYRALQSAQAATESAAVHKRINQLLMYARYCTLFHQYREARGEQRQQAFEQLIRHAWRIRSTMMIHSKALYRDLAGRDRSIHVPPDAAWNVPESQNPWKSSQPVAGEELQHWLKEGILQHPLTELDFEPVRFGLNLVPAAHVLSFPTDRKAGSFRHGRGVQRYFTWVDQAAGVIRLNVTGGLIEHYRDRGNVRIDVWQMGGASETGERETKVVSDNNVPPDGKEYPVELQVPQPGLYRIDISDGHDMTRVRWPPAQPMTIVSTSDVPMNKSHHRWSAYFFVPAGTRRLGLYGGRHGNVCDSQGRIQLNLEGTAPDYRSVAVPPGEDGRIWEIRQAGGMVQLLTVPSCFAISPQGLLLPAAVVTAAP